MSDTKPKLTDEELRRQLTDMQYQVTQCSGTEPPFRNEHWDNKEHGIYVDLVSGEPLFSSLHKFDSGTGWPSFTRPLEGENVTEHADRSHGVVRTEVRSTGPGAAGLRYCINSAALRFIGVAELEAEGYGEHLVVFIEAGIVVADADPGPETDS